MLPRTAACGRRAEFLDFIFELEAAHPGKDLHIILDILSTHRVTDPSFWQKHLCLHFHFTPTHSSWLNQIEVWFSILSRKLLSGANFTSVKDLIAHIEAFIRAYNVECLPFEWRKVNPEAKSFSGKYADLCK